eukprot:1209757-Rhodomonas_salina.1
MSDRGCGARGQMVISDGHKYEWLGDMHFESNDKGDFAVQAMSGTVCLGHVRYSPSVVCLGHVWY